MANSPTAGHAVIRCDHFPGSGLGHLKRCAVLAKALLDLEVNTTLIIDSPPRGLSIPTGVDLRVLGKVTFNEVDDSRHSTEYAISCNASHLVIDSYRVTDRWVQMAQSKGFVVVAFDDLDVLGAADIRVNYSPSARPLGTPGVELIGPRYFVTDLSRQPPKAKKQQSVIFHAGAKGDFSGSVPVVRVLSDAARGHGLEVCWLIANAASHEWLESSGLLSTEDRLCHWQMDKAMNWADFDIVVGPPSTSLYEAVMQGALPISYVISDTQSDRRAGWLSIGHALHLTSGDCRSPSALWGAMSLAVKNYSEIIGELERNSVILDGLGASRVANTLLMGSSQEDPLDSSGETQEIDLAIHACGLRDAENFLLARNSPLVRQVSTSGREIEWIEHLNWWLDSAVERFAIGRGGQAAAYFWHRPRLINNKSYLIGGWFPAHEGPLFSAVIQLITWQLQHCSSRYPGHIWLATISATNRAVIALNRRFGFVDASPETRADAEHLFPGTIEKNFVILERPAKI